MGSQHNASLMDSGQTAMQNSPPEMAGPFHASEAIAAGAACSIDVATTTYGLGVSVKESDSDEETTAAFAGVAIKAYASGDKDVYLVKRGIVTSAKFDATAKDPLKVGTAPGVLIVGTVGTDHIVAYALETDTSSVGAIYVTG